MNIDQVVTQLDQRTHDEMQTRTEEQVFLSVVTPFRDAQGQLHSFSKALSQVLDNEFHPDAWEIIFVDANSRDDSFKLLTKLASQDSRIRACRLAKNYGYQKSLLTGYRLSRGQVVLQMDCQSQSHFEMIPSFLEEWRKGFSVVHGVERSGTKSKLVLAFQRLGAKVYELFAGEKLPVDVWNFRLLDREVVDRLKLESSLPPFLVSLIHQLGFKQIGIAREVEFDSARDTRSWWQNLDIRLKALFKSPLGVVRIYLAFGAALLVTIFVDWIFPQMKATSISIAIFFGFFLLGFMSIHLKKIYEQLRQAGKVEISRSLGFSDPSKFN